MVGRFRSLLVVVLGVLAVAAPAYGGGGGLPHLSRAQTRRISVLVNRFVKDVVLRENLADGWAISGPQMRGGTTRAAWVAGKNLPVQHLPLDGTSWANSWYATYRAPNEFGLDLALRLGHGENAQLWDEEMVISEAHGKLYVNGLYTNAVVRLGKKHDGSCVSSSCKITGIGDLGIGTGGGLGGGTDSAPRPTTGGGGMLYVLVGSLAGVPLSVLLGYLLYVRSRNRRAWAEYVAHANRTA